MLGEKAWHRHEAFYKICMEYLICLGVCVGLRYCGGVQTAVLMPFHLGYVQFGRLFIRFFRCL